MYNIYRALRKNGVIGINERNVRYVSALNPRKYFYKVDDKEVTKTLAAAAGIPTPELYGVIKDARDMKRLPEIMDHSDGFVIKPAQGSQGKGIFVVEGPLKGGWRLSSGRRVDLDDIKFQINNMLSGMYSLGGQPDKALIEYRVKFDDIFGKVSYKGVPDIRLIVLKGIPIFSMVRLPTAESDGKANLHKGGVGVGVNIATGLTARAMQFDRLIDIHPDTAHPLEDIQAPYWEDILLMAAKSYDVTGLGYIGVDVVLDREKGPLLLELNARPGISIQIANRRGMREVLERAMSLSATNRTAKERVQIAKELAIELNPIGA
ncbi:alpha-L-glutamate ligase-like protein [Hyphococcus formosus]|uniref:alpha-L-glutamate ligase-like protein n=1 Tax=Hyphococcus formosus TaxID=3143534 RepID=UPI00398AAFF9